MALSNPISPTTAPQRRRLLTVAALLACGLALLLVALRAATAGASGDTVLTMVPVGEPRAGQLITVRLVARNAQNLAGFQGTVQFDAAGLRLSGANVADGLARRGAGLLPLGPVMGDGSVALGAVSCAGGSCAGGLAASGPVLGVSGQVELGTLEFSSAQAGQYTLSLSGVKFVDPQGNALAVRAEPLTLDVRAP
jgi:hypothetical protein